MITNNLDLPQPFVNAAAIDDYDSGKCDISTTELIDPPLMVWFKRNRGAEIVEDAADLVWLTFGKAWHHILEIGCPPEDICEKRYYAEMDDWVIGSRIDYYCPAKQRLEDWKLTSAWTMKNERQKKQWERQLNIEAWNLRKNGIHVRSVWVTTGLRDWSLAKLRDSGNGYPKQNIVQVELPLWPEKQAEEYVSSRVRLHQDQWPLIRKNHTESQTAVVCEDTERWKDPDVFAVMLPHRKSAVSLYALESEAVTHAKCLGPASTVQKRVGESVRCKRFCAVRSICPARRGIAEQEGWTC